MPARQQWQKVGTSTRIGTPTITGTPETICDLRLIKKICGFAIWGLAHLRKLLINDSGMSPKFADLQIVDFKKSLAADLC
jgi:hypothetical protein